MRDKPPQNSNEKQKREYLIKFQKAKKQNAQLKIEELNDTINSFTLFKPKKPETKRNKSK